MALKIRLARAGSKKRPYYHIVIAAATLAIGLLFLPETYKRDIDA